MKGLIISGCFIVLSKSEFLDLPSFGMAVVSREKRGRCVFPLCSAVSCSCDMLRKKTGQQKMSTLKHSHRKPAGWLASWGLLAIFLLPLGILSCIHFQHVDFKLVLFGVSILEAPLFSWEVFRESGSITRKVI